MSSDNKNHVIKLVINTPDDKVFEGEVENVYIPSTEGICGILPGHAHMLAAIDIGTVSYIRQGIGSFLKVATGFGEIHNNSVTLSVEIAEFAEHIDVERAKKALERSVDRLSSPDSDVDIKRAERAFKRANARIEAHHKYTYGRKKESKKPGSQ